MSLRERFGLWLAGHSRQSPPPSIEPFSSRVHGPGLATNQPAPEVLLRETIGMVKASQRAIANRISSLQLQVKTTRSISDGTTEDEILDDHALTKLFKRPHPDFSMRLLLWLTAQWITSNGQAYWFKIMNGFGTTQLNPMAPVNIDPLIATDRVVGYRVLDADGRQRRFPRDEFVRIYLPDPAAPFQPEGYLGPAGIVADAHKFATQHLRTHFEHDATPKIALEAQAGARPFRDQEERDYFYQLWRQMFHNRRGEMTGVPPLLPVNWKLVEVAMQSGMEISPLLEYFRDDLLMGFGVPKSVLGMVTSGDRSSAEVNAFVFDQHSISPIAQIIADALTMHLATDYVDEVFVDFAPFVGRDKQFELEQEKSDLEHAVRNINQVLRDRGFDPVPWGEKPTISTKIGPYDPERMAVAAEAALSATEENEDEATDEELRAAEKRAQRLRRIQKRRQAANGSTA